MLDEQIVQPDVTTEGAQVEPTAQAEGYQAATTETPPENPYEARLRELEALQAQHELELQKKDEIIARKEESLRKKVVKVETPPEFEDRFKALEERLIHKDVREHLKSLTSDPHEQELAFRMYQDRIVKTGNIAEDVKMAFGAANADLTLKSRQQVAEQEVFESSLASRASTHVQTPQASRSMKSPQYKLAESLLDRIEPGAKKHLSKYLN